jgi:diketogulonate reductase-like aldo/keto reductase
MRTIAIGTANVPVLGQGTWYMGEDRARARAETAALLAGLDAGMTLIDTAEMYGDGATETFVGKAIAGRRDEVFLVSKAYPQHGSREGLRKACEGSLRRLGTDRLDLYLLHWPGSVPIAQTVEGMEALVAAGKIARWGVSNFDVAEMEGLVRAGGDACATDQVLYNVTRRGLEYDLAPWLAKHRMPLMAYSPVEQGSLPSGGALDRIAARHAATPFQVALAWLLAKPNVLAIPKAGTVAHVAENRAAADLVLDDDDLAAIDAEFPPPRRKTRLAML